VLFDRHLKLHPVSPRELKQSLKHGGRSAAQDRDAGVRSQSLEHAACSTGASVLGPDFRFSSAQRLDHRGVEHTPGVTFAVKQRDIRSCTTCLAHKEQERSQANAPGDAYHWLLGPKPKWLAKRA
jgi:hypothetical protein